MQCEIWETIFLLCNVLFYRLHEFDDQVKWVREGMSKVIPVPLLSLFTGLELETMVFNYDYTVLLNCDKNKMQMRQFINNFCMALCNKNQLNWRGVVIHIFTVLFCLMYATLFNTNDFYPF